MKAPETARCRWTDQTRTRGPAVADHAADAVAHGLIRCADFTAQGRVPRDLPRATLFLTSPADGWRLSHQPGPEPL